MNFIHVLTALPRPIEVQATSKPRLADCAHLRTFRLEYRTKVRAGLVPRQLA